VSQCAHRPVVLLREQAVGFGRSVYLGAARRVLAFAAGAILTMLASTMMPEAFEHRGNLVGVLTTLGFAVAFTIHILA
jgi:zinc transporter ZupT